MSEDATTIEIKGLEQLLKALKGKQPTARVGILGDKTQRSDKSGQTNADIGAKHEFGTSGMPQRSFLRVPIEEHLNERLESSGAMDPDVLKQVIAQGSIVPWLKKVAVVAEGIVAEAFDSGGFGKWKPSNMANKKNKQTLVETQQLRNSITSEVA